MAGDARERPIIFSAPMVRAILDGRKTMTRRIIKPQPSAGVRVSPFVSSGLEDGHGREVRIPWRPGDRAWVKEAWRTASTLDHLSPSQIAAACLGAGYSKPWAPIRYEADGQTVNWERGMRPGRLRASMHMPRWASRIGRLLDDVRVQRLQDISEEDARAEGWPNEPGAPLRDAYPIGWFANLWGDIHGPDAWDRNEWVVALTFRRIEGDPLG